MTVAPDICIRDMAIVPFENHNHWTNFVDTWIASGIPEI
jgi:hypothetical protein